MRRHPKKKHAVTKEHRCVEIWNLHKYDLNNKNEPLLLRKISCCLLMTSVVVVVCPLSRSPSPSINVTIVLFQYLLKSKRFRETFLDLRHAFLVLIHVGCEYDEGETLEQRRALFIFRLATSKQIDLICGQRDP